MESMSDKEEIFTGVCCSVFFFSSRRRHTRFDCDWSSDVCSSDLRRRSCSHPRQSKQGSFRHRNRCLPMRESPTYSCAWDILNRYKHWHLVPTGSGWLLAVTTNQSSCGISLRAVRSFTWVDSPSPFLPSVLRHNP